MLKNPGGESLQAFLQVFTDTILDQVPDRITALSQVSSPATREAPRQFRAIRNDLDDQNAGFAFSPIQSDSGRNIQFSSEFRWYGDLVLAGGRSAHGRNHESRIFDFVMETNSCRYR